MDINKPNPWMSSSAERSLEETAKIISSINLNDSDFIGTKEDGYTITSRGKHDIRELAGFIPIEEDKFKEPVKDIDSACFYFANKKREVRVAIESEMKAMKESREESLKPQGMGLPDFLREEANNEGKDNSGNAV